MPDYTVVVAYNDDFGSTAVELVQADDPQSAADEAIESLIAANEFDEETAALYRRDMVPIAVFEGHHLDVLG